MECVYVSSCGARLGVGGLSLVAGSGLVRWEERDERSGSTRALYVVVLLFLEGAG